MKYQTKVTVPDDIKSYFEPFLGQGDVAFDNDWNLRFTFDAEDLWEAHELVSGVAREADATYGRVGGQTDFTRAIAVGDPAQVKLSNSVAELSDEPHTERVYMTAEAAQAARADEELEELERSTRAYLTPAAAERAAGRQEVDAILASDDENLREHTARSQERYRERMDADVMRRMSDGSLDVEPGMGATLVVGSDKYPFTVSRVERFKSGPRKGTPRAVWARRDDLLGTDTFIQNLAHEEQRFTATATRGAFKDAAGCLLRIGRKSFYQAPEV